MPIYEYQCAHCHYHFDILQKISDKPVSKCPKCERTSVEKMVSAPGFQLKGTGWYETDFKNKGKKSNSTETKPVVEKSTDKKADTTADSNKVSETK